MTSRLEGKVAIVTGSAGGIGAVTAQVLASEGAAVVVADIDAERATAHAERLRSAGARAIAIGVDIADETSVRAMVAETVDAFGRIDLLHNNAASRRYPSQDDRPVAEADVEVWNEILRVNVIGTMLCTKHVLPVMIAGGGGSIVVTASDAGLTGALGHPAYGASKGALVSFVRYVATQYGKHGIRCNAISPGLIVTENVAKTYGPGPLQDMMLRNHLTPRLGLPDDIAGVVTFLASQDSAFITGQVLCVDGGLLAHAPYYSDEVRMRQDQAT